MAASSNLKNSVGRPVDHQKTEMMFDAIDLILANEGIAGLSIEKIAKNASISKATLYRRFGSIKGILAAYVDTFTQNAFNKVHYFERINQTTPFELEPLLNQMGIELMTLVSNPKVVAFDNAILASGQKFKDLKQLLYSNGPHKAANQIGELLKHAGVTSSIFDFNELGDLLFHIWRSGFYDQVKITGEMKIENKELEQHIADRTRFFLSKCLIEDLK